MTAPLPDLREGAEAWVTEHVSCPNPNCKRLNLCAECMTIVSDLRERDRQWRDMVVDALARLAEVERERDEARKRVSHLEAIPWTCAYCGAAFAGADRPREDLQAHVAVCDKHPLHAAEQRLARLRPFVRATHAYRAAQREHAIRVLRQQSCERERVAMDEAENAWMIAADECDTAADRAWATEEER